MDRTHNIRQGEPAGSANSSAATRRARLRDNLEQVILIEAERIFAEKGFDGATVADLAQAAGLSKQNLMYYFPTKLALYERVLDDVLGDWLRSMYALAYSDLPMPQALRAYIHAKLDFSRRRPAGSRVYALEVIGGAKHYAQQIRSKIVPVLRADIATLNRWMKPRADAVSAEHLMFTLWAATQSYADFSTQMQLIVGRKSLTEAFFAQAEETVIRMVLGALGAAEGSDCTPCTPSASRSTTSARHRVKS